MKRSAYLYALVLSFAGTCCTAMLQAQQSSMPQTSGPALEERHPRYVIQREDALMLTFPLSPELNQTVTVQPDGYITLLNVGAMYAKGFTAPELVEQIKKAYAGVLHDPIVTVDIQDFQKPLFTVTGQVIKPGQYELRQDITIAEALAVAGGLMPTAKTQILLYHRTSKDWWEVKKVNMKDILQGKNVNEDAYIQPGDMVFVPEKYITNFRKYVPYGLNTAVTTTQ